MVLKGQYLERPTLIPVRDDLVLEGLSHRGKMAPGVVVIPPPPFEGSGMDHIVCAEIAFATARADFPSLRFNFRGVGASQGERSTDRATWLEDVSHAIDLATENSNGAPPVITSINASDAIALQLIRTQRQRVSGVVFVNPHVLRPDDLPSDVPLGVVVPEDFPNRAPWAARLVSLEGAFEVIAGADKTYQRNLPLVGKAVVTFLIKVNSQQS